MVTLSGAVSKRAVYEVGIEFPLKELSDVASANLAGREFQSVTTLFVKVQTWPFMEDHSRMASILISRCNGVFHSK